MVRRMRKRNGKRAKQGNGSGKVLVPRSLSATHAVLRQMGGLSMAQNAIVIANRKYGLAVDSTGFGASVQTKGRGLITAVAGSGLYSRAVPIRSSVSVTITNKEAFPLVVVLCPVPSIVFVSVGNTDQVCLAGSSNAKKIFLEKVTLAGATQTITSSVDVAKLEGVSQDILHSSSYWGSVGSTPTLQPGWVIQTYNVDFATVQTTAGCDLFCLYTTDFDLIQPNQNSSS